MKKVLVVGDSLAGGLSHLNFWMILDGMSEEYSVSGNAMAGDTMAGINRRMERLISQHQPDILLIEGGGNDVFLPFLKKRGGLWRVLANRLEKRGSVPAADASDFRSIYSQTVSLARGRVGEIMLTTITCIGEDLGSETNKVRGEYNDIIRRIANEEGVLFADTGKALNLVLEELEAPSGYLAGSFLRSFTDVLFCLTARGSNRLSAKRGLALTVDGLHFNPRGARVFAEAIHEAIVQSKTPE